MCGMWQRLRFSITADFVRLTNYYIIIIIIIIINAYKLQNREVIAVGYSL